ncbi:MAG: alanine--tRNA ligase [Clostridia bacterium]|nr:alanine--tRNA ligase [Clostridia bacterium]
MIKANELREKFIQFFKEKGHAVIPSASVIPENDPTVLFTTAGMHPLVPYLLGAHHPEGTRLTDVQKCIRTGDIDEVGDASHLTFFEMLGNWSLGDYFKKEMIAWSWEFLTDEKWLGLDKEHLAFSVFAGDETAPRDEESYGYWREMGVPEDRLFFLPRENNWWGPAGITGPCGPDTEMFIIRDVPPCGPNCSPACDCGRYLEIWNDVFMQYNKQADGSFLPLAQKNVDTGMGLERTIGVLQNVSSVYETDLFLPIIGEIETLSGKKYGEDEAVTRAMRIVADHIRSATFILGDERGVTPSNVDQGYVLRRLIRRAVRFGMSIDMPAGSIGKIAQVIVREYKHVYPELGEKEAFIVEQLTLEENRFAATITQGLKEFEKVVTHIQGTVLPGKTAFRLYDTFGYPLEMTIELAKERGFTVDIDGYNEAFKKHQEKSRAGSEQRFKGGLADSSEQTAHLHTATHLLLAGLKKVLSPDIIQKGSNITAERLRFDFNFPRKVTREELDQVEDFVNEAINAGVDVTMEEMPLEEARKSGATGTFSSRYGERVKVYTIGNYSKEICGGPHATNTAQLEGFKIKKEESSSAGVRRIKAVIGPEYKK